MLNNALLNNFRQAQLPSLIEFYSESRKNVVFNFSKEIYKIFSIKIVSSEILSARWRFFLVVQPIRGLIVTVLMVLGLETTG